MTSRFEKGVGEVERGTKDDSELLNTPPVSMEHATRKHCRRP